ncbi:MAG: hypothetical protein LBQ28_02445 [Prevotellaceae bacterium]|jgi:ABC-type branched-subunit amino acid transport system permease subunit|nr:hypothetical protein [Prevotellaceae bacterium]
MSRKTLNIITIVLFVVSIIVGIFTFANSTAIKDGESGLVNPLFVWTLLLLIVTVVLALLMPLPAILKNPKMLKKTLFVIVGIVVAFGVVYFLSQGNPDGETIWSTLNPAQKDDYQADFVVASMNIIAVIIALVLAVVAVLWSAVKGFVKK